MANGSYGSLDIGTDKKTIKMYQEECVSDYDIEGDEYDEPINNPDHGYAQDGSGILIDGGAEIGDLIKVKAGHYRYQHIGGRHSCQALAEFLEKFSHKYGNFKFALAGNEGGMGFIETYNNMLEGDGDMGEGGMDYDDIREAHGIQAQDYVDESGDVSDEYWDDTDKAVQGYIKDFGDQISTHIGYDIHTLIPHKVPTHFRVRIKKVLDQE